MELKLGRLVKSARFYRQIYEWLKSILRVLPHQLSLFALSTKNISGKLRLLDTKIFTQFLRICFLIINFYQNKSDDDIVLAEAFASTYRRKHMVATTYKAIYWRETWQSAIFDFE